MDSQFESRRRDAFETVCADFNEGKGVPREGFWRSSCIVFPECAEVLDANDLF